MNLKKGFTVLHSTVSLVSHGCQTHFFLLRTGWPNIKNYIETQGNKFQGNIHFVCYTQNSLVPFSVKIQFFRVLRHDTLVQD